MTTPDFRALLPDVREALELSRRALGLVPEGPAVTPAPAPAPAEAGDRPLWVLMNDAYMAESADRCGYAAEMRVVADELQRRYGWHESSEALRWLRAEAERAEAGEP